MVVLCPDFCILVQRYKKRMKRKQNESVKFQEINLQNIWPFRFFFVPL